MKTMVYTQKVKKNVEKRYLALSDLQVFNENDAKKLYAIIKYLDKQEDNDVNFDAIFLVGDIIDGTNVLRFDKAATNQLIAFIKILGSYAPTFICYGNQDLSFYYNGKLEKGENPWCKDERAFKEMLLDKVYGEKGINILDGTTDIGDGYTVSVYNPSIDYALLRPTGDNRVLLQEKLNYDFLRSLNPDNINTLLCHYPNVVRFLFEQGMLENVDLSIGGHYRFGDKPKLFGKEENLIELSDRTSLLVNPAYSNNNGINKHFDVLRYQGFGATEINFVPEDEEPMSRSRRNRPLL